MQQVEVRAVVVHDEHPQPLQVPPRRAGAPGARTLPSEAGGEPEGRALARLALHADRASHHRGELPGDRQAEAGPPVPARGRPVGLREGAEDPLAGLRRDADPGIRDLEAQGGRVRALRVGGHPHDDLTPLGELDGVAGQVDQDLAQPAGVSPHLRRDTVVDDACQLQPLAVGALRQEIAHVLDGLAQVEIDHLQLQLPCLDLGKIQDVVDHAEERFRRGAHRLGEFPLLRGQLGVQDEVGHADDSVHRRADLMAHVRQELGLGVVGALGLAGQLDRPPRRRLELVRALLDLPFERRLGALHLLPGFPQPPEHGGERRPQLAQLVARLHLDRMIQPPLGDGPRRLHQRADRGGDLARQEDGRGHENENADRRRGGGVPQEGTQSLLRPLPAQADLHVADDLPALLRRALVAEQRRLTLLAGSHDRHDDIDVPAPVEAVGERSERRPGPLDALGVMHEGRHRARVEGPFDQGPVAPVGESRVGHRRIGVQALDHLLQRVPVFGVDGVLAVLRHHDRHRRPVREELAVAGDDLLAHGEGAGPQDRREDRGDDQRVELGGQPDLHGPGGSPQSITACAPCSTLSWKSSFNNRAVRRLTQYTTLRGGAGCSDPGAAPCRIFTAISPSCRPMSS